MTVDDVAANILADIGADFKSRGRGAIELQTGYLGKSVSSEGKVIFRT